MKKILFVCTGNTCRSPMAAALMNRLLADEGLTDISAESAGLAATAGSPASPNAVAALAEMGVDLSRHSSRQVTGEMMEDADYIYVMTASHRAALAQAYRSAAGKIRVLGDGIPDPYGGSPQEYKSSRDSILAALNKIKEQVK